MADMVINTDTNWSALDPAPSLDTRIAIEEDAVLTLDTEGLAYWINVENGTLRLKTTDTAEFVSPSLTLKDDESAGILIGDGEIEVLDDTPTSDPTGYEEILEDRTKERPKVVIRNNSKVRDDYVDPADNKWYFLPYSLEWSLHNPHLLETYNTFPLLTYWEEVQGEAVQRTLKFEEGIWGSEKEKEVELHKNTMDGGNRLKLSYDRTESKTWNVGGVFDRRYDGKERLRRLYNLSGPLQRDSPVLFVCEDVITYVMIRNVEHETKENFYEWEMEIEEQVSAASDRIYTAGVG